MNKKPYSFVIDTYPNPNPLPLVGATTFNFVSLPLVALAMALAKGGQTIALWLIGSQTTASWLVGATTFNFVSLPLVGRAREGGNWNISYLKQIARKIFFVIFGFVLIVTPAFAQNTYNLTLTSGDNFISLPLTPQDKNITTILAPIITQVKDVWEFDPLDVNDPWKHYQPGMEEYSDLKQMDAGRGYWINLKSNVTLQITGTSIPENALLNLKPGWNIIAWPYQSSQAITAALSALNFGTDYTQVSRFNPTTKAQENFQNQPTSDNFNTFEPGRSYYIYMLTNKTIRIGIAQPVDVTAPTGTITINTGAQYSNTTSVTLTLSATDLESGMGSGAQMQFSNDNITYSSPEAYSTTKAWTLTVGEGIKTVYVKFKDAAGNWSSPVSGAIILDTIPPAIIITSPQNNAVLEDTPVILQGTVDGAPFSDSWPLTPGDNTLTKTATDSAGNASSVSIKVFYSAGTLIGIEGGEVISSDGKVKLIIPPGALTQSTNIKVLNMSAQSLQGAAPPDTILLSVVECKPYNLTFLKPVTVIYKLNFPEIPGTPVSLGLYDPVQDKIFFTSDPSLVPIDGYTLTFSIMHFSTYAALKGFTTTGSPIGGGAKIPLPDMFTGSFSSGVPITVPPGRKGLQPSLSLTYRSSNPNSWVGVGYSLEPGYIVRSTKLGPPSYNDTQDTFYLITDSGTTEFVHLVDNLYQAKIESSFSKFYKDNNDYWKVVSKDGSTLYLGQTLDSKETSTLGTFSWHITRAQDTNGNYIDYTYNKDQGKPYLSRIDYTGNQNTGTSPTNTVEFILEPRTDIVSSYISTTRIATAQRLKRIEARVSGDLVWEYLLEYAYSLSTNRSLLKSVTQRSGDTRDRKSLPTQTFYYQEAK